MMKHGIATALQWQSDKGGEIGWQVVVMEKGKTISEEIKE